MEESNDELEIKNKKKLKVLIALNICYPIIYIVSALIIQIKMYKNWQDKYIQISQVGSSVSSTTSMIGFAMIALYIILIVALKPKKKLKNIIIMTIILILLIRIIRLLNSWA